MRSGKLVIVTGTPGTGVRRSLAKYEQWCIRNGHTAPKVLALEEDFIIPEAKQYAQDLLEIDTEDLDVIELLRLPKQLLNELWRRAFDNSITAIRDAHKSGTDVIPTFHAVWYHLRTREYLSGVDFQKLQQSDIQADAVVTLVDDIYDVKSRLSSSRGIFSVSTVEQEFTDAVVKLLRILDWRDVENVVSSKVAQFFSCHHYVLATKHPIETFHNLVTFAGKPIVYIAHPISQVRRMSRKGHNHQAEADQVIQDVKNLATALRNNFTMLEPTAIDELRFDHSKILDGERIVLPELSWRWPLPSEHMNDLLWDEVEGESAPFGPEWSDTVQEIKNKESNEWTDEEKSALKTVAPSLLTLQEHIRMQITSRDFTLGSVDISRDLTKWRYEYS